MVKTAVFIVLCVCLFGFCSFCNGQNKAKAKAKAVKYEAMLTSITECKNPQPPYAKKRTMYFSNEIIRTKRQTFIKGNVTVTEPVPFRNYNGRVFLIDGAGHRELKFQILKTSCRSIYGASVLNYTNVSYTKNNCSLVKGEYLYNVELNSVQHLLPIWPTAIQVLQETQLIVKNATVSCHETIVKNVPV